MAVKVVKFGGSSLADAGVFKKVADIIKSDSTRRFVIPSAPGKRFPEDTKVTDMLYKCYDLASRGESFADLFDEIKERYMSIIRDLNLNISLDKEFEVIKQGFIGRAGRDYAASRGEYLNGLILAKYLGFVFVDAADVVFFDEQGTFDSEKTNDEMGKKLSGMKNAVIPGFYGSMPNDTIKTFSRGGSDITGSIVARAVKADLYENWTDVTGFLVADPRIVKNPETIDTITYRELRELSYMGATVLHEDAIFPVRISGIPINIKNTLAPEAKGTMIVPSNGADSKFTITGIAGKKGFSFINMEKAMMNQEIGFVKRMLTILENFRIPFEHLPSGIDTLSVVLSTKSIEGKQEELLKAIREEFSPDYLDIEHNIALIAVVGRGMIKAKGTAARVFAAVAHAGINIRMIDQGSSELNIILGVCEKDFEAAVNAIYDAFIN